MKESRYKSYDELPLFLNTETVAKVLGISPTSGYELMHEEGFPLCGSAIEWRYQKKSLSNGWMSTQGVDDDLHKEFFLAAQCVISFGTVSW